MRKLILAAAFAAIALPAVSAQAAGQRDWDYRHDARDYRHDERRDYREARRDFRHDRRDWRREHRWAYRHGNYYGGYAYNPYRGW